MVDKYEDVLVVECLALGMEQFKETIVSLLKGVLKEDGISIRGVYERSDANERRKEGLPKVKGFIGETFDTEVEITENGVHYLVDVVNGQKTGFFLDQKYNRLAMQRICKGKRVLDCFTHMGTFALNAGIAGASDVTGLDISEYGPVCRQVIHQGFIQLYLVKLHDGKNGHIGIVGPKVVQGDAKSRFPKF